MTASGAGGWMNIVQAALGRAWLAASAVAVLGGAAFIAIDHDNPLDSDDPYVIGLFLGCVAGALAALYSIAERIPAFARHKDLCSGAALLVWCSFWFLTDLWDGEAPGYGRIIGLGSFLAGATAWVLCRARPTRRVALVISSGGVLFLVMYGVVCVRMAARFAHAG